MWDLHEQRHIEEVENACAQVFRSTHSERFLACLEPDNGTIVVVDCKTWRIACARKVPARVERGGGAVVLEFVQDDRAILS